MFSFSQVMYNSMQIGCKSRNQLVGQQRRKWKETTRYNLWLEEDSIININYRLLLYIKWIMTFRRTTLCYLPLQVLNSNVFKVHYTRFWSYVYKNTIYTLVYIDFFLVRNNFSDMTPQITTHINSPAVAGLRMLYMFILVPF